MANYATIADLTAIWRAMSAAEQTRATQLIELVSAELRIGAKKAGKDLDEMIAADPDVGIVAKSVTCDVVARALMTSTDSEPMTQTSESALGYSVSGTFLVPGGGLFIKRSEWERLGIRRQRYGVLHPYKTAGGEVV